MNYELPPDGKFIANSKQPTAQGSKLLIIIITINDTAKIQQTCEKMDRMRK